MKTGRIRAFFGDAKHDFQLNIGELEEIEEETGEGFGLVKARLSPTGALPFGGYSVRTVRLVLRLGLIGGGMDKERAARLVDREVVPTRLGECALLAWAVTAAAEVGAEDPGDLGEPEGEAARQDRASPTAEPTGDRSTAPAAPSAGRPTSSRASRSASSSRRPKATAAPTA